MSASSQNNIDVDALLDFSACDGSYNSPSLSPSTSSKPTFASPVTAAVSTPSLPTSSQTLSGPSHNYDMYRQQTGFVPGALTNTMAVNQTNNTGYQDFGSLDYLSSFSPENDVFDFNASPSQATMDMEFESTTDSQFFSTVNPSSIEQDASPLSQTSSVGRLWPGAHSQAALAKAQAQQRQQQLIQHQAQRQSPQKPRGKAPQPTDPIVEQKITQLLNSMRAKAASDEPESQSVLNNLPKAKKDEEEMDEDERLLASEEGKKLSSKERRQLRNKVSARAFRSRRKEYISQLEAEIANKVNENGDLRSQNRALMDENKRLSDLTRMLLSSPSFSTFLDHLSTSPTALPQGSPVKVEQTQQQEQNQVPKDVNAYNGQFSSQQQIGMAMIPEQTMDFSLLSLGNTYNFQPQVFVVDTPEMPNAIDASVLSGKTSNFVEESFSSEDEKVEVPVIERPVETKAVEAPETSVDEEFESDPEFALFHSQPATTAEATKDIDTDSLTDVDLFGGIESEKVFDRYELVDATEEEATAVFAMARVQRISATIDSVVSRLELLTMDL
ncbi:bZIP transcription factor (LziP) [Pochonia chlamydosporia 170]|uniref:BZIP transcription factor (LziP) n=1 Tax=Pochonia chlamydosporia 170 TaxID=1380566 RepID=A0A179F6U8_METCM|nr:bZIP transcription factor (LziP) [Pochonia chlamydosporia 170]OAQ61061.1 bZIP transcription factor (LziP) [Pochonia chlamydosporia 170]